MPTLTRVCAWSTCQRIATQGRYCHEHAIAALARRNDRRHYDRRQSDAAYDAGRSDLEAFYGRKAWKQTRAAILRTEPLCRMCAATGLVTAATLVDHILPFKQRPDLALAWDNLQPLCRACHDKKTRGERATPWHLIRIAVTLVCGPPGSGKTTYCRQRMAPGDILIDLDAIMEQLSGLPRSRIDSRLWWRQAVRERNHMLSGLTALTTGRAWVIMTAPKWHTRRTWAERLKAQTVIIEADESTCTQRIAQDTSRNPASRAAEIDAVGYWWRTYQNGVGETVLR